MKKKMAGDENGAKLIPDENERKLREIGFDFTVKRTDGQFTTWEDRLEQLKRFKEVHGHCRPMKKDSTGDFEGIYQWSMHQRSYMRRKAAGEEFGKKSLPDKRELALREIGFEFD